ncbi:MAG: hypothetical protein ACYS8Z_26300, partial [Planctomycetota bacterium]
DATEAESLHTREPETQKPQRADSPPQAIEEKPKPEPPVNEPPSAPKVEQQSQEQDEPETAEKPEEAATSEQLLSSILDQLKSSNRSEMFDESFSAWRFMAGAVQGLVALCMLITIWLLMSPERNNVSVLIGLGFATVLQLMALTFYMIQDRK